LRVANSKSWVATDDRVPLRGDPFRVAERSFGLVIEARVEFIEQRKTAERAGVMEVLRGGNRICGAGQWLLLSEL